MGVASPDAAAQTLDTNAAGVNNLAVPRPVCA